MSHYEERLQKDLDAIRASVGEVGKDVTNAVQRACRALLSHDRAEAAETIVGDMPINRAIRRIDKECHFFVARHLPSAGILRFISSVLRLTIAIERIGDYAAKIARETVQLSEPVSGTVARDVELMSEQSLGMLKQALKAFVEGNADQARGTMGMAAQVDSSFERVFADLLREGEKQSRSVADLFALLTVFHRLERISDQAKNICEETVFAVTGETKEPKVYRILFIDGPNDLWSPMAEAIAAKAFPNSGTYASAGWAPAEAIDATLDSFLEGKGVPSRHANPVAIPTTHDELDDYHVIINLDSGIRQHLAEHPFKTTLLDWDLVPDGAITPEVMEDVYKKIAVNTRELMEKLRGEDAD
ncbi:MAG: phosphate signaling complex protein PhoU [Planctomycetota bacterium]|nr:phosphate signaling complex protein PhoU [Planctomycetota bacterium]